MWAITTYLPTHLPTYLHISENILSFFLTKSVEKHIIQNIIKEIWKFSPHQVANSHLETVIFSPIRIIKDIEFRAMRMRISSNCTSDACSINVCIYIYISYWLGFQKVNKGCILDVIQFYSRGHFFFLIFIVSLIRR